jgi:hypothetical protein
MVESVGNAPTSACLQGKCIACLPRPRNWQAASVPPGVSWVLETRPRADAQPVYRLVRLPGIAPGPSPWQGDILLLDHNRESERAGNVRTLPAQAISTKNKHLLAIYAIPARGFMAVVSVFRGTPPAKPLEWKIQC